MKTNYLILNFLFFLTITCSTSAQQSLDFTGNGGTDARSGYFTRYITKEKYEDIDGSPFYNNDWQHGSVKLESDVELKLDSCKYDIYVGKLMFLNNNNPLYFSNPTDIESFNIGETKFINQKSGNNNKFYECIYCHKDLKLLKEYKCIFIEGRETDGIVPATKDKYTLNSYLYLKEKDSLIKIKQNKRFILKILKDKEDEIKRYIKENHLNLKKENDVINVFKFYFTLI